MTHLLRYAAATRTAVVPWLLLAACRGTSRSVPITPRAPEPLIPQRSLRDAATPPDIQSNAHLAGLSGAPGVAGQTPVPVTPPEDAGATLIPEPPGHFTELPSNQFLVGITATVSWSKRAHHVELAPGGARQLMFGSQDGDLVVVPFLLVYDEYEGYERRGCGIAIFRSGATRPIDYPAMIGGYDTCTAIREVTEVDVNHDGVPDFVFEVKMHSRGLRAPPEYFPSGAVYVSNRKRLSYCYAPEASRAVTIDAAYAPAAAVAAIEGQAEARGAEETFACGESQ